MSASARGIVREVLSKHMADEIWATSYDKVLPITFNAFDISEMLPAVFYMFRTGRRRGGGHFLGAFAPEGGTHVEKRKAANVERVASILASDKCFEGFELSTEQEILGDMLLCYCLGNTGYRPGRNEAIQRVVPAHFLSSWIDLPHNAGHLRFVPEMIVTMLANQDGAVVQNNKNDDLGKFPIGPVHKRNLLLSAFSQGIRPAEKASALNMDTFDEECEEVGIDQLLMIRLALSVKEPPVPARGSEGANNISNQHPISKATTMNFSEDLRNFVESYSDTIPRRTFVDLLETCLSVGISTIFTSVGEMMLAWSADGRLPGISEQRASGIFVDCSSGINKDLRRISEQSLDDLFRRLERLPEVFMTARLLDYTARHNRKLKDHLKNSRPYATEWLNLLGDVLHGRHEESGYIFRQLEEKGESLAMALEEQYPDEAQILRSETEGGNPISRLATVLSLLLGRTAKRKWQSALDSVLNVNRPNGLAVKRRTVRGMGTVNGGHRRDVRSYVLPDSALDYLVHLQLIPSSNEGCARDLSLTELMRVIQERYGLYVAEEPPHMSISNELLHANKARFERRLRDLGLLVGVNDAESMKRVEPRFQAKWSK